jgi:hypothetical protein
MKEVKSGSLKVGDVFTYNYDIDVLKNVALTQHIDDVVMVCIGGKYFITDIPNELHDIDRVRIYIKNNCPFLRAYDGELSDYLVYTEKELKTALKKKVEELIGDAKEDIPKYLRKYFDEESYRSDLVMNSNGCLLASNGEEYIEIVENISFYIYKK